VRDETPPVTRRDDTLLLGDNNRCNNTALRKATRRVSQLYDAVLAPTGLRSTQRSILSNIARFGSPTMGELAASLVLDRSALGHNLKPLERDGFIVLVVDPEDRRNRLARLTPKGKRKLEETAVLWNAAQERFESKFGVARARALREVLAVIAAEEFDDVFKAPDAQPAIRRRAKSRAITTSRY
jgi:DNA-binding MarR family transcriptional regulator